MCLHSPLPLNKYYLFFLFPHGPTTRKLLQLTEGPGIGFIRKKNKVPFSLSNNLYVLHITFVFFTEDKCISKNNDYR